MFRNKKTCLGCGCRLDHPFKTVTALVEGHDQWRGNGKFKAKGYYYCGKCVPEHEFEIRMFYGNVIVVKVTNSGD